MRRVTGGGSSPLPALHGNPLLDEYHRAGPVGRHHPARRRLARRYAYGVPSEEALALIAAVSPQGVVELGAGTGYWARLLHERGVDVVAIDRWPPGSGENRFVDDDVQWFTVLTGDERSVAQHADRTLLLVWPTWNETWPADAVANYYAAGGATLVFVGEGPGGLTGDGVLQAQLGAAGHCLYCSLGVPDVPCVCGVRVLWRAVRRVSIPQWADADDACTVYVRIDRALREQGWRRLAGLFRRRDPIAVPRAPRNVAHTLEVVTVVLLVLRLMPNLPAHRPRP